MTDYTLKFKDEAQANKVLGGYEGSIDTIGVIDGATGWHVNVRGPQADELDAFVVEAATPTRVWA